MTREEILKEMEIWDHIADTKDENAPQMQELLVELRKIDIRLAKYCAKRFKGSHPKTLRQDFIDKGIIDERNKYNFPTELHLTEKTPNFGYENKKYYLNPRSANMLYKAYLDFADGKIDERIRPLDYANIGYESLNQLNQYECLYWCYVHNITFLDFAKMNFIHECAHKIGCVGAQIPWDPYLFSILGEGITERIARDFARDENIPYIPIFRKMELEVVDSLFGENIPEIEYLAIVSDNDTAIINMIQKALKLRNYTFAHGEIIEKHLGSVEEVDWKRKKQKKAADPKASFIENFHVMEERESSQEVLEKLQLIERECQELEKKPEDEGR